ncbi:protein-L-isoaspartate O-methyltransferase [Nocardiopsis mangrovi]|uniref:Protein-L-isoaspartate O-methyltransferase n=1 Tax=Nocardiopsis mangrovi TaxID=1179818 RepID=A0ABV9E0V6_9ACTN
MATAPDQMTRRLDRYANALRDQGTITSNTVQEAFATIERHKCVTGFYYRGEHYDVPQDATPGEDVLDIIYSDASLMTIMPSDRSMPASSSSAPTIMGPMIEALDLTPGMRVLEIGAGTGYNAALIATITGAEVVTIEAGSAAAAGAAASISRLGMGDLVRVVHTDGYDGPGTEPGGFDRIIVTVGIAGVPPAWLDQLAEGGFVLAPTAHGGMHPTMELHHDRSVRPRLWSDFMTAVGPLRPAEVIGREPGATLPGTPGSIPNVLAPLETDAYNDCWFHLAAHDPRTTRAYLEGTDPWGGMCAIVADDTRAAWLRTNGSVMHTDPALGAKLAHLVRGWDDAGRPPLTQWSGTLTQAEYAPRPLLIPSAWSI